MIPLILMAAGAAASMYGANKQAKANSATQDRNIGEQREADRQDWLHYLMQRGIYADPNTQQGVIPGATPGAALNTKLPLYAKVLAPSPQLTAGRTGRVPFLVKKG